MHLNKTVAIRPGVSSAPDPFTITDTAPGALSVRVPTLATLLDLLAGGLRPRERAVVEEAISFAFARACFADGRPPARLGAPRLGDEVRVVPPARARAD